MSEIIRFSGLSSGLDTQSMVDALMDAANIKKTDMERDKDYVDWQIEDYRSMNSLLTELDDCIFDGIGKQSTFVQKSCTSSNLYAVSAENINSTNEMNTNIWVSQLAENAYMNSTDNIDETSFDPDATLLSQIDAGNLSSFSSTFTIQAIGSDGTLGEEVTFTIDPNTDSLNSIIDEINDSEAGVGAFYDEQTGRISISAENTGNVKGDAEIKLTGDFFTALGFSELDNITSGGAGNGKEGQNAVFEFNGLLTERSSNTFRINGYEYTLSNVTDDGDGINETGETVTISSSPDVDAVYNEISNFVNTYNSIIEQINSELDEQKDSDYSPLSDKEKEAMTDDEIKLWEEKARAGTLSNDRNLSSTLRSMRNDLSNPVDGIDSNYNHLSEIGITTSNKYLDAGKLVIDEAELRQVIEDNPIAIYNLFNGGDGSNYNSTGIADRLRDTISGGIEEIENKSGNKNLDESQYSLGRDLGDLKLEIDDYEDYLVDLESRYWKQFSYMEQVIANSNSQKNTLLSYFS